MPSRSSSLTITSKHCLQLPHLPLKPSLNITVRVVSPSKNHLIMSFTMRQPFRLTSTLGAASKSIFKSATPIRSFHSSRPAANFFTSRTTTPVSTLARARNAFRSSRTYMQEPIAQPANNGNILSKLAIGGAMFGGTLLASESFNMAPPSSIW